MKKSLCSASFCPVRLFTQLYRKRTDFKLFVSLFSISICYLVCFIVTSLTESVSLHLKPKFNSESQFITHYAYQRLFTFTDLPFPPQQTISKNW